MIRRSFSDVLLVGGVRRTIALLATAGDVPCISVARTRSDGSPCGRTLFHLGPEVDALERAIKAARDPGLRGSWLAGTVRHCDDVALYVRALCVDGFPPTVGFRRRLRGRWLGKETKLSGDELTAIERAAAELRKLEGAQR